MSGRGGEEAEAPIKLMLGRISESEKTLKTINLLGGEALQRFAEIQALV